jgi:hypothetical protein
MVDQRATLAPLARSVTFALFLGAVISACGDDEPSGGGKPDSGGRGGTAGASAGRGGASGNSGRGGAAGGAGDTGVSGAAGRAGTGGDTHSGGTAGADASTDAADANAADGGGIVDVCARLGNVTLVQNEFIPRYFGDIGVDCRVSAFVRDNPQLPTMGDKLRQFNAVFWGCDRTRPIPGFNLVHFWNTNTTLTSADAERLIDIYVRIARTALTLTLAEDARMRAELTRLSQTVVTEQSGRYSRSKCDAGSDSGAGDAGSDADDGSVSDGSDDGSVSDASADGSDDAEGDADTDDDGADS